jgi:hypothetical protein
MKLQVSCNVVPTMITIVDLIVTNVPKASRKRLQVAYSCKYNGCILIDFC